MSIESMREGHSYPASNRYARPRWEAHMWHPERSGDSADTSYRAEKKGTHPTHWPAALFCRFRVFPCERSQRLIAKSLRLPGLLQHAIGALQGVRP
jgi:hypothetical protein